MPSSAPIATPDDPLLDELCRELASRADQVDLREQWPAKQLEACARYGVFRWFLPQAWGGLGLSEAEIVRGYLRLSAACLTTAFIITQRSGACRRIVDSDNAAVKARWLPWLADGSSFATVGISHLTTSRRHLARPVLRAEETPAGFVLEGFSPWVTGAGQADVVVLGATLDDGRQILVALPSDLPGVVAPPPLKLVGLSASCTGPLECHGVTVPRELVLFGPNENVLGSKGGAATGGLQTSALAVGLADAVLDYLAREAQQRPDLGESADQLRREHRMLRDDLCALAAGQPVCTSESLRTRANSLVLRAAEAALVAAKGSGYVMGHPAGRWCREALFFLVWSCPQPVLAANLCEFAGLGD
jgi:alkylation response protein AidB-like acyl-CoA dehydrogenase